MLEPQGRSRTQLQTPVCCPMTSDLSDTPFPRAPFPRASRQRAVFTDRYRMFYVPTVAENISCMYVCNVM